jgi:hypothetical protein
MKPVITLPILLALSALASTGSAQNPGMSGKWVLNPEKSQGALPVSEVLTYEIKGGEEHYIVDETDDPLDKAADKGARRHNTEYTARFDNREYPNRNLVTGNVGYVSVKQVFPRVEELTYFRHTTDPNGKEVSEMTGHSVRILAADGKEFTSVLTNAKGEVTSVRVFERQSHERPR